MVMVVALMVMVVVVPGKEVLLVMTVALVVMIDSYEVLGFLYMLFNCVYVLSIIYSRQYRLSARYPILRVTTS